MDLSNYTCLMANGVDLNQITGVGDNLIFSIISEIGLDLKNLSSRTNILDHGLV